MNFFKSLDGFPIYGRYLDDTAPGYSIALDDCGGHTHSPDTNSYGYHYHSQVLTQTITVASQGLTVGQTYNAYITGPYKCWKGDISKYPGFWTKSDYTAQCCSMNATTQAYAASGVTFKVSASTVTTASRSSANSSIIKINNLNLFRVLSLIFCFIINFNFVF